MVPGEAARTYHELTSYSSDREWTEPLDDPRLRHDIEPNDLSRLPWPTKRYPQDLPRLELPRDLPGSSWPVTEVLSGERPSTSAAVDVDQLGRLLFLSAGVVRYAERGGRTVHFRAAGSAGNRHPLEVYLACCGVPGVPDGVHWYDPVGHALVAVGPPPRGDSTTLVLTGVPWRTGWRYAERGYRHIYWDAGTLLAQAVALGDAVGWQSRLRTVFPDNELAALVGADGIHEFPVALLSWGDGRPAVEPTGQAAAAAVDADPQEYPLVTATQRAGDGDVWGDPWPDPAPLDAAAPVEPDAGGRTVDDVVLRRGSSRRMDPAATLPEAAMTWALRAATRGIADAQRVVVHGVDDVAPGVHHWDGAGLVLVREGDLRAEATRVCLDQGLGGDAAYVVCSCADLDAIDDRGYRDRQLSSGLVEGRLHLAAYAQGHAASGMTFLDSEISAFLDTSLAATLFTCVGVPEYPSGSAGLPGRPAPVRVVMPR